MKYHALLSLSALASLLAGPFGSFHFSAQEAAGGPASASEAKSRAVRKGETVVEFIRPDGRALWEVNVCDMAARTAYREMGFRPSGFHAVWVDDNSKEVVVVFGPQLTLFLDVKDGSLKRTFSSGTRAHHGPPPGEKIHPGFASIPYAALYRLAYVPEPCRWEGKMAGYRIRSRLENVSPADISLSILRKSERIAIPVETAETSGWGGFSIPFSGELLAENPMILSNQPKGTLSLEYYFDNHVAVPATSALPYRELMKPALQGLTLESLMERKFTEKMVTAYPEAFLLKIPEHGQKPLVIRTHDSMTQIFAERDSSIFEIPLHPRWMEQNPEVILPGPRAWFLEFCGMENPKRVGRLDSF